MENKFKPGDKVWHPKTKLFGFVIAVPGNEFNGDLVVENHIVVNVSDSLHPSGFMPYTWSPDSIELLDEEEYKLTAELVKWKRRKTEINKLKEEAGKEYAVAEEAMIAYLMRMAIQGTRQYAGIGQVTIDGKNLHTSISEEKKEAAFKEIEAMGRGEIIKRTIHPSTLESFVSELQDHGIPVPKNISVYETPKLSFAKKR